MLQHVYNTEYMRAQYMLLGSHQICCLQFGAYLTSSGFPSPHNVTAADPAAGYTILQNTDLQYYADLHPVLGTCFSSVDSPNANQTDVNQCASSTDYCCYNFTANPVVSPSGHSTG